MEMSDLVRYGCNTRRDFIGAEGLVHGKAKNMSQAIRCLSNGERFLSCADTAISAATWLDLVRSGQTTFAELTNKFENGSARQGEDIDGLSLAESAPANMSPDQLGRTVYRQCSTNVVIH
jgi:hypothetical protein